MKQQILKTIKKYNQIKNGDSIVIGVSGRTRFNMFTRHIKRNKKRKTNKFQHICSTYKSSN